MLKNGDELFFSEEPGHWITTSSATENDEFVELSSNEMPQSEVEDTDTPTVSESVTKEASSEVSRRKCFRSKLL